VSDISRLGDYLHQMAEAARDAQNFTEGMDCDAFLVDLRTQRAVIMSLMIVGEAATRLIAEHPGFTETHSNIAWRSIRGMRNRIAHGYFDLDLHIVWQTIQTELPGLVKQLEGIQADR